MTSRNGESAVITIHNDYPRNVSIYLNSEINEMLFECDLSPGADITIQSKVGAVFVAKDKVSGRALSINSRPNYVTAIDSVTGTNYAVVRFPGNYSSLVCGEP